jgi:diguanylate cyclase (GGDEF)-like protein
MHSLFQSLLGQHPRQLLPVRCTEHTSAQLYRYLEDVVLESKLAALVVESFPPAADRPTSERLRLREIGSGAQSSFFLVQANDSLSLCAPKERSESQFVFVESSDESRPPGRFLVIADARFSALIASAPKEEQNEADDDGAEVIWTFEPDVVYSALEYLMARITAEFPERATEFANAVKRSMPKATSLQLTLSVTTKLALLLQAQGEREIAVNRIATAIRNVQALDGILATVAVEVRRALKASSCGLRVTIAAGAEITTKFHVRQNLRADECEEAAILNDLDLFGVRVAETNTSYVCDADHESEHSSPTVVVPLGHHARVIGLLLVRSDDPERCWTHSELLLLHTVADQVTVAINQAHLFAQLQEQALTDGLTGLYNRRAFEMQLGRDLKFATRTRQPLSLVMLDLDNLKDINDKLGHEGGDNALRLLAESLGAELRGVDTSARYGGDEFIIILPQAGVDGALAVAERLRERITQINLPDVGSLSASFGLASFPLHASSQEALTSLVDQALYTAKRSGRNRVSGPPPQPATSSPLSVDDQSVRTGSAS